MVKIYPKIADISNERIESVEEEEKKYNGVEVQFFHNDKKWGNYDIEKFLDMLLTKYDFLEEITVHPPLEIYDIELLLSIDKKIAEDKLKICVKLAKKYNVKINMLFHVTWPLSYMKLAYIDEIKDLLKIIENTNVTMLIENTFDMELTNQCTVLEIANIIDSPKLKVCIDMCHLHCVANKFKITNFREFINGYLDKEMCKKYVYQIHFAATLNNDGIVDKKTHGRMHETLDDLKEDLEILKENNMADKNFITEVSEEDYFTRVDQKREFAMLDSLLNK